MEAFILDTGRPPDPGELEAIVALAADEFAESPELLASGVRRVTAGLEQLPGKWTTQLVGSAKDQEFDSISDLVAVAVDPAANGEHPLRGDGVFECGPGERHGLVYVVQSNELHVGVCEAGRSADEPVQEKELRGTRP